MRSLGLDASDFGDDMLDIWPDNWRAVELFASIRTQWRVGPGGPYGLDYNVLDRRVDALQLDANHRAALNDEIQVMEFAALEVING